MSNSNLLLNPAIQIIIISFGVAIIIAILNYYKRLKFLKFLLDSIFGGVYKNVLGVSLAFGFVFLYLGYSDSLNNFESYWKDIFQVMGTVSLSSGVFMAIAKSYQFTEIFKNELKSVIYSSEHLGQRKDLDKIWESVTGQLCDEKFNDISPKLQKIIKDYYLPLNHEYYYDDYNLDVEIEHDQQNPGYIYLTEDHSVTVITEDDKQFVYTFETTIPYPKDEKDLLTNLELVELKINNDIIPFSIGKEMKMKRSGNKLSVNFSYKCKEVKDKYVITRTIKKSYSLSENPYYAMLAVWLYQDFTLNLEYPKNMDVELLDIGVLGKWTKRPRNTRYGKKLKATYSGLIFKNQGFLVLYK